MWVREADLDASYLLVICWLGWNWVAFASRLPVFDEPAGLGLCGTAPTRPEWLPGLALILGPPSVAGSVGQLMAVWL